MRPSPLKLLLSALILTISLTSALPQAPSPSPTPTIPWPAKYSSLRASILALPDRNASAGFSSGPTLTHTFPDDTCYQVRFYNWDCTHAIPYKMRGVAAWLDASGAAQANMTDGAWVPQRSYIYGYYADPDDGWGFYGAARLAFGSCGNRGPQSTCGMTFCVDGEGKSAGAWPGFAVPVGESPYLDPNNKDNLCPWLRNGTAGRG